MLRRTVGATAKSDDRNSFEEERIRELTDELERTRAELRTEVEHRREFETAWRKTEQALRSSESDLRNLREVEHKLKESEARLRQVTDNMRDLVGNIDTGGIFQYLCASIKHLGGYDPADLVGKSILEKIHPDDRELAQSTISQGLQSGCWERMEVRYRHAKGHYLWLEIVGNSVFDGDGRVIGATLGSRDITDREAERRLQEQLEFLQLLLIPSPVLFSTRTPQDATGVLTRLSLSIPVWTGMISWANRFMRHIPPSWLKSTLTRITNFFPSPGSSVTMPGFATETVRSGR